MGKKWQSVRCSMGGKPVEKSADDKPEVGIYLERKCPRCQRRVFPTKYGKYPTHGAYKASWGYGE